MGTVSAAQMTELAERAQEIATGGPKPTEIQLGKERFLAASVGLSSPDWPLVTLTVLKIL